MGGNCCKCDSANKRGAAASTASSVYRNRRRWSGTGEGDGEEEALGVGMRAHVADGRAWLCAESASRAHPGTYVVRATNAAGAARKRVLLAMQPGSSDVGQQQAADQPPTFARRLTDLAVKVGSRTRLLVEIASASDVEVVWYRNDRRLMEAERFRIFREGRFFCVEVSPVSVEDGGRWTCTAENCGGHSSCSAHLNVLVPKAYKRPEFLEELRALLTEQGTVSLECKVVGVPTPVLRWFKDSKEIKAGDVFALTANPDDPTSLGTYTCEAVNCMGKTYSSSEVHVVGRGSREGSLRPADNITSTEPPPIFTKELEDQSVKVGEKLTLSCQVVVPPWPKTVTWYNKEGRIEPSERYRVLEDGLGGYMVEVPNSEWSDEGEWKCVATSNEGRVGISTSSVAMAVPKNYRKPRFMENLKAVLTEEGLVSFECKVVGFPTPLLSWFKDGQELKPGDVYQLTGTNSLGSYCCIAKNCMGQASSSAELTVEDIQNQLNDEERLQLFSKNQAPKFIQGLKSQEAKINENFRFTVKVSFIPEPSLFWYRDDQPIEDSSRYKIIKESKGVCHLDIQQLEFMDQAEWKCFATNDFGHSVTSCFLKLIIPRHFKKPRFLENLRAILSEEGAVNLECKVIGVPQPILKWYKDGEELKPGDIHRIISGQDGTCCLGTYTCEAQNCMGIAASSASLLGFEDTVKASKAKKVEPEPLLQRNISLSTIHEERTSQMYDTPVGDVTLDEKGEISFSFDGKEVSVSLYETPDLTEEEALQIVEMYADQLSENVTEHNVVELPPLRFVKETSTSGNLLMEAILIDVSPDYFISAEEDLRTEADVDDMSIIEETGLMANESFATPELIESLGKAKTPVEEPQLSLPKRPPRKKSESIKSGDEFYSLSKDNILSVEVRNDDSHQTSVSEFVSIDKNETRQMQSEETQTKQAAEKAAEISHVNVLEEALKKLAHLSKIYNVVQSHLQAVEEEVIMQAAKMSSAAAANKSLEIISSMSKPVSELQTIIKSVHEKKIELSESSFSEIFKSFIEPIKNLHDSLAIVEKCVEMGGKSQTLVQRTSVCLIETLGKPMQNALNVLNDIDIVLEKHVTPSIHKEVDILVNDMITGLKLSEETIKSTHLIQQAAELNGDVLPPNQSLKAKVKDKSIIVQNIWKPVLKLEKSVEAIKNNICADKTVTNVDIQMNDYIMDLITKPIQELQVELENIEQAAVQESQENLYSINTGILETVVQPMFHLRNCLDSMNTQIPLEQQAQAVSSIVDDMLTSIVEIKSGLTAISQKFDVKVMEPFEKSQKTIQQVARNLLSLQINIENSNMNPEIQPQYSEVQNELFKILENAVQMTPVESAMILEPLIQPTKMLNESFALVEVQDPKVFQHASMEAIQKLSSNIAQISTVAEKEELKLNMQSTLQAVEKLELYVKASEEAQISMIQKPAPQSAQLDTIQEPKGTDLLKNIAENIMKTILTIEENQSTESVKELSEKEAIGSLKRFAKELLEFRNAVAAVQISKELPADDISTLSEFAITNTLAKPLYQLNQCLNQANEMCLEVEESRHSKQEVSLLKTIAKPLYDFHNELQVVQNELYSQICDKSAMNIPSPELVKKLHDLEDCLLQIQQQVAIEPIDDISTLDDISAIKTTAEAAHDAIESAMLLNQNIVLEKEISLAQDSIEKHQANPIQRLLESLNNLQQPQILEMLNDLSDKDSLSQLKTMPKCVVVLQKCIEVVQQPLQLEAANKLDVSEIMSMEESLNELKTHVDSIQEQASSNKVDEKTKTIIKAILQPISEVKQSISDLETNKVVVTDMKSKLTRIAKASIEGDHIGLEQQVPLPYEAIGDISTATDISMLKTLAGPLEELRLAVAAVHHDKTWDMYETIDDEKVHPPVSQKLTAALQELLTGIATVQKNLLTDSAPSMSTEQDVKELQTAAVPLQELYKCIATVQQNMIEEPFDDQKTMTDFSYTATLAESLDTVQKCFAVLEQHDIVDLSCISDLQLPVDVISEKFAKASVDQALIDQKEVLKNVIEAIVNIDVDSRQMVIENTELNEKIKSIKNQILKAQEIFTEPVDEILKKKSELDTLLTQSENIVKNIETQNLLGGVKNEKTKKALENSIETVKASVTKMRDTLKKINTYNKQLVFCKPIKTIRNFTKQIDILHFSASAEGSISKELNTLQSMIAPLREICRNFEAADSSSEPLTSAENISVLSSVLKEPLSVVKESAATYKNYLVEMNIENSDAKQRTLDAVDELCSVIEICMQVKPDENQNYLLLNSISAPLKTIGEFLMQQLLKKKQDLSELDSSKLDLAQITEPIRNLQECLAVVQKQLLECAEEDTLASDLSLADSYAEPIVELQKELSIIEEQISLTGDVASLSEHDKTLIKNAEVTIHELKENISAIQENLQATDVACLRSLTSPLNELEEQLSILTVNDDFTSAIEEAKPILVEDTLVKAEAAVDVIVKEDSKISANKDDAEKPQGQVLEIVQEEIKELSEKQSFAEDFSQKSEQSLTLAEPALESALIGVQQQVTEDLEVLGDVSSVPDASFLKTLAAPLEELRVAVAAIQQENAWDMYETIDDEKVRPPIEENLSIALQDLLTGIAIVQKSLVTDSAHAIEVEDENEKLKAVAEPLQELYKCIATVQQNLLEEPHDEQKTMTDFSYSATLAESLETVQKCFAVLEQHDLVDLSCVSDLQLPMEVESEKFAETTMNQALIDQKNVVQNVIDIVAGMEVDEKQITADSKDLNEKIKIVRNNIVKAQEIFTEPVEEILRKQSELTELLSGSEAIIENIEIQNSLAVIKNDAVKKSLEKSFEAVKTSVVRMNETLKKIKNYNKQLVFNKPIKVIKNYTKQIDILHFSASAEKKLSQELSALESMIAPLREVCHKFELVDISSDSLLDVEKIKVPIKELKMPLRVVEKSVNVYKNCLVNMNIEDFAAKELAIAAIEDLCAVMRKHVDIQNADSLNYEFLQSISIPLKTIGSFLIEQLMMDKKKDMSELESSKFDMAQIVEPIQEVQECLDEAQKNLQIRDDDTISYDASIAESFGETLHEADTLELKIENDSVERKDESVDVELKIQKDEQEIQEKSDILIGKSKIIEEVDEKIEIDTKSKETEPMTQIVEEMIKEDEISNNVALVEAEKTKAVDLMLKTKTKEENKNIEHDIEVKESEIEKLDVKTCEDISVMKKTEEVKLKEEQEIGDQKIQDEAETKKKVDVKVKAEKKSDAEEEAKRKEVEDISKNDKEVAEKIKQDKEAEVKTIANIDAEAEKKADKESGTKRKLKEKEISEKETIDEEDETKKKVIAEAETKKKDDKEVEEKKIQDVDVETKKKADPEAEANKKTDVEADAKKKTEVETEKEANTEVEIKKQAEAEVVAKKKTKDEELKQEKEATETKKQEKEAEAKKKADADAKKKVDVEVEAKKKTEEEKLKQEEATEKKKQEEEAEVKKKAEAELKKMSDAEADAKKKADEEAEAKKKADEEKLKKDKEVAEKKKLEEEAEAKKKAEAEAKKKAEAEDEAKKKADEEKLKKEKEAAEKKKQEEEAEAQKKTEADAEAKKKSEEEKLKKEKEAAEKKKQEEEAEAKMKAEAEAKKKADAEAEAKKKAEADAEAKKKADEEKLKKEKEAAEKKKQEEEAEAKKKAEVEAEAKKKANEEKLKKEKEVAEKKKQEEEAEAQKKTEADAEAKKKSEEEKLKKEKEAAEKKKQEEEAEAKKKAEVEAEAKKRADEEKLKKEKEAAEKKKQEEEAEARKKAEAEAKKKAEAEAEAKKKAEAEVEAKKKAEAEAEAKKKAEAEAEAKKKADDEAEAKKKADEEKLKKDKEVADKKKLEEEAEAKKKAEAEAKKKAEAEDEAKKKADEEKLKKEKEAAEKKKQEEEAEAKKKAEAEAEAKKKADEEKLKKEKEAAEKKKQEEEAEAKKKAEAEAKKKAEAEAKKKADEEKLKKEKEAAEKKKQEEEAEAKKKAEAEAEAKKKADEEKLKKEKEAAEKKKQEEEAEAKKKAEAEAKKKAEAEAEAKKKADEEKLKKEKEAAEKKKHEEDAEAKKKTEAEAEAKKKADEEKLKKEKEAAEKKKLEEEAEAKKKAEADAEAKKKSEEEKLKKEKEAAEKKKQEEEAEAKKKAESEAKKKADDEAEAKKKAEADAEAKKKADEEKLKKDKKAAEKKKLEDEAEAKKKAEAEAKKKAEAEAQAKKKADEEKLKKEKEAADKKKQEEEAEAKKKVEAEAKIKADAEAEAKKKAEEENLKKEKEAAEKKKQEEEAEAKKKAEAEAKKKADAEAEAKKKAEADAEAKKNAEEEKLKKEKEAAEKKKQEEEAVAKKKAEAEAKKKSEDEKLKKEKEAAEKKKQEEEAEAKKKAEAEAKKKADAEAEAKKKLDAEAEAKKKSEEVKLKKEKEAAEKKKQEEVEAKKKADAEDEAKKKADAELKAKKKADAEAEAKKIAEEDRMKKEKDVVDKKKRDEEAEAKKKADAEAEAKKKAEAEIEAKKKASEKKKRDKEAEAKKKAESEAEAKKKADSEAEAKRIAEEDKLKKEKEAAEKKKREDSEEKRLKKEKEVADDIKRKELEAKKKIEAEAEAKIEEEKRKAKEIKDKKKQDDEMAKKDMLEKEEEDRKHRNEERLKKKRAAEVKAKEDAEKLEILEQEASEKARREKLKADEKKEAEMDAKRKIENEKLHKDRTEKLEIEKKKREEELNKLSDKSKKIISSTKEVDIKEQKVIQTFSSESTAHHKVYEQPPILEINNESVSEAESKSKRKISRDEPGRRLKPEPHLQRVRSDKEASVSESSRSSTLKSDGSKYTTTLRDSKKKPVFCTNLTDRTAVEGSRVKLTCSVLGSPEPNIEWFKNGVILRDQNKYRMKFGDGLCTLEVLNALPSDSADYTCTASNENGTASSSARLKVYAGFESTPIPPTFTRSIKDTYHMAEDEMVLECRIRGQPCPTITWMKDGRVLNTDGRYSMNYLADGVCRLIINHPDSSDSGKYTCKAENNMWSDQIYHDVYFSGRDQYMASSPQHFETLRYTRAQHDARRPHFSTILSDHSVPEGGTIALQVHVMGGPADVVWLRGEEPIIPTKSARVKTFVDKGLYTLALAEATDAESGKYTCRAINAFGKVDMEASVNVVSPGNVRSGKPAFMVSRPDPDITVYAGEDISMACRAQGDPKPKMIWLKGMHDITNSRRSFKQISDDYCRFTLKRAVTCDAGTYCIMAKNCYGCDRAFVTVVVKEREIQESSEGPGFGINYTDVSYLRDVPGAVSSEPVVVDGGRNWVSLWWGKATVKNAAPVLAYKVEAWLSGGDGGARWAELGISPINSFDAFNLKPGGEYLFRVTPKNRYGWGESCQTSSSTVVGKAVCLPEFVKPLPGQMKALIEKQVVLKCKVKADPTPTIVWHKDGAEIDENDRMIMKFSRIGECSLTINPVTEEDTGRYMCEAIHRDGRASTFVRLSVVVDPNIWEADDELKRRRDDDTYSGECAPQFTMRLRDRRVQVTYPVRLTCQVIGKPIPSISWMKNGFPIQADDRYTFWSDDQFHTLEISQSTLFDGGYYSATASNARGSVSCRCSLVVDKGIRAYISPDFFCGLEPQYMVKEGEELRISACVEAYPSVGIAWHRDGVKLRPSRRAVMTLDHDGGVELALANVTSRDSGVYTCTATNEVGKCCTSTKVVVEELDDLEYKGYRKLPTLVGPEIPYSKEPMFVKKPRSSDAMEGDTVIILCEVTGDPKPEVIWLRDFLKPEYYRDARQFRRVGEGPEYRLLIPHAKLDHTGAYSVIARNCHGEAKAVISLQIYTKGPDSMDRSIRTGKVEVLPSISQELKDLRCCDGDAVTLECRVKGTPAPTVKWEKDGVPVPNSGDFNFEMDGETAKLVISTVYPEDEGMYTCIASNALGKAYTSSCLVVDVPEEKENLLSQQLVRPPVLLSAGSTPRSTPCRSPSPSPATRQRESISQTRAFRSSRWKLCPPKFYAVPFNRVAEEGETVVFRCSIAGHPVPWVIWDKDGVEVTPSSRITIKEHDEDRILQISDVTVEDAGLYKVTVDNEVGRVEATARLEVIKLRGSSTCGYTASDALVFRRKLVSSKAKIGEDLTLKSELRNYTSSAQSKWYKNGHALNMDNRIFELKNNGHIALSIKSIRPEDKGTYTLIVSNSSGDISSWADVSVVDQIDHESPKVIEELENVTTFDGETLSLVTKIKSDYDYHFTWTRDGQVVPNCDYFEYVDYGNGLIGLRLEDIFAQDSGTYSCIVSNDFGTCKSTCRVQVEDTAANVRKNDISLSQSVIVEEGKSAVIEARVLPEIAKESYKVVWELNGKLVKSDDNRFKMTSSDTIHTLTLLNTHRNCSGVIRCAVRTEQDRFTLRPYESLWCSTNLTVVPSDFIAFSSRKRIQSGPNFLSLIGEVRAVAGQRTTVKVLYKSDGVPKVRWIAADHDVTPSNKYSIETNSKESQLTINNLNKSDNGMYKVEIEDHHGSDSQQFFLIIDGPPDPVPGKPLVERLLNNANVSWLPLLTNNGSPILGYHVEMCSLNKKGKWETVGRRIQNNSFVVKGLNSQKQYIFRIRAENAFGLSEPGIVSDPFGLEIKELDDKKPQIFNDKDGSLFNDKFKTYDVVGRGKFGIVKLIVNNSTSEKMAAKFVKTTKPSDKEKVFAELEIMHCLTHPKLIKFIEAYMKPSEMIIVTEYISGGELFERVSEEDFTLTERDCALFLSQICEGVQFMHDNNIVHLDLKPENIMCQTRPSQEIKIIDFGLAKRLYPNEEIRVFCGTPEFLAPEVVNFDPISKATDMWSVGVICYVLLSGLSPFSGDTLNDTYSNILQVSYDFDDEAFDNITNDAKEFIENLLIRPTDGRRTASECLQSKWIQQHKDKRYSAALSTDKLKKFVYQSKWQIKMEKTLTEVLEFRRSEECCRG